MQFQVVTKTPDWTDLDSAAGNAAVVAPIWLDQGGRLTNVPIDLLLHLRAPVFTTGEILVVDDDGREICGRGRKANKWDVVVETFDSIDDAVARAIEVSDE